VIAFADDVQFPDDSCYRQGLAVATSANKEKLSDFALRIQTSLHSRANYSNAFTEAFRLLATTNDSDSVTTNGKRGMKQSCKIKLSCSTEIDSQYKCWAPELMHEFANYAGSDVSHETADIGCH